MSGDLREEQVEAVKQLQGKTSTMVCCVPARLFFSGTREKAAKGPAPWIYSRLAGALSLTIDRRIGSWVLRLFAIEQLELCELFECELYANLQDSLLRLTPTFLAFQMIDGFLGFQFLSETDADLMAKALRRSCEHLDDDEKRAFIARLEKRQAEELGLDAQHASALAARKAEKDRSKKKKKGGFGGWLKRVFGGGKKSKPSDPAAADTDADGPRMGDADDAMYEISLPRGFVKTSHIGWDPKKNTFLMDQVPDDVKSLLRRHKIKKKYLKDQKLAPAIFDILTNPAAIRDSSAYRRSARPEPAPSNPSNNPFLSADVQQLTVEDHGTIVGEAVPAIPAILPPAAPPPASPAAAAESKEEEAKVAPAEVAGSAIPSMGTSSVIPAAAAPSSLLVPPPPPPPPAADPVLSLAEELKQLRMKQKEGKAGPGRGEKLDLKKITQQEENTLMSNLQNMIAQRRSAIEKSEFNDSEEEDSDSDWSDDDYS